MKINNSISYGFLIVLLMGLHSCASKKVEADLGLSANEASPSVVQNFDSATKTCVGKSLRAQVEHGVLVDFVSAYGYLASRQFVQARSAVQLLLNKYPHVAMTHVLAADLLRAESNKAEAMKHLVRAQELAPHDGQIKASLRSWNGAGI